MQQSHTSEEGLFHSQLSNLEEDKSTSNAKTSKVNNH